MNLAPVTIRRLVENARQARAKAYAPYSKFQVGAAVLTANDLVFCGCNVENVSLGLTMCAERNAVAAAVLAGQQPVAVAVIPSEGEATPCGACRQVLAEFAPDMPVIIANAAGEVERIRSLRELLPDQFRLPTR